MLLEICSRKMCQVLLTKSKSKVWRTGTADWRKKPAYADDADFHWQRFKNESADGIWWNIMGHSFGVHDGLYQRRHQSKVQRRNVYQLNTIFQGYFFRTLLFLAEFFFCLFFGVKRYRFLCTHLHPLVISKFTLYQSRGENGYFDCVLNTNKRKSNLWNHPIFRLFERLLFCCVSILIIRIEWEPKSVMYENYTHKR